jgi:hypothetical protein
VGPVVNKTTLRQVFSEYFGFPCQAFHPLLKVIDIIPCFISIDDRIKRIIFLKLLLKVTMASPLKLKYRVRP